MNDYREPGQVRESALRKQGADALLRAAAEYLQANWTQNNIPAGRFLIHLMWALDASPDGKTYQITATPNEPRCRVVEPAPRDKP